MKLPEIKFAKTESLVLRCCRNNLTSPNGFKWKKAGVVKAPDWKPLKECGNGLHGWLKGEGKSDVWEMRGDDVWMVLAVKTKDIVDLNGKVKFPSCRVLYVGKREIATALVGQNYPTAKVIYGTATAGDYGTAIAGEGGTATAVASGPYQHAPTRVRILPPTRQNSFARASKPDAQQEALCLIHSAAAARRLK